MLEAIVLMSALLALVVFLARSTVLYLEIVFLLLFSLRASLSSTRRWCWLWMLEEASTPMEWMHLLHLCLPLRNESILLWYQLGGKKKKVKVHIWSHAWHSPALAHSAFACVLGTMMPADWLNCISTTWLISPAPIWSLKGIAVGYVCGTATALLNQKVICSHLGATSRNLWSGVSQTVQES